MNFRKIVQTLERESSDALKRAGKRDYSAKAVAELTFKGTGVFDADGGFSFNVAGAEDPISAIGGEAGGSTSVEIAASDATLSIRLELDNSKLPASA